MFILLLRICEQFCLDFLSSKLLIERNRSWGSQKTRPKSERDDKEGKRDNREKEERQIEKREKNNCICNLYICLTNLSF